mgnify:CR=1 FL=1|jgi:hypothetical protein
MTSEPQWETTEHGWHAVATLSKGYQWTAYIEYVDAPYWRIWAGCMFDSLHLAQEWCHAEIAHQIERLGGEQLQEMVENNGGEKKEQVASPDEPDAWNWLWMTLSDELGDSRAKQLRNELNRRLQQEAKETV